MVAHIDHMRQLVGHTRHIGLGSDLDGGFGREHVPTGLDSIADLPRLGQTLAEHGYSPDQVEAILGGNWLSFLRRALPATTISPGVWPRV